MDITIGGMTELHNGCVKNLDDVQHCGTCSHEQLTEDEFPCNKCYNEFLGMPVNPTEWEEKDETI